MPSQELPAVLSPCSDLCLDVGKHYKHCPLWQTIGCVDTVEMYARHFFNNLGVHRIICVDVILLHRFYKESRGFLPSSRLELEHFWKTNNIPTPNLQLLTSAPLLRSDFTSHKVECAMCFKQLSPGMLVHKLPCGHFFHTTRTQTCNLLAWLQTTNKCPCCDAAVAFIANPLHPQAAPQTTATISNCNNSNSIC